MASYIYDMVDTWDNGATTFTSIKMNVTDTASNAASLLMDLQVGGSSRFNVGKTGNLKLGVSPTGTNQAGTNVIIAGSQGTGTGAGGSIVFQVAPAGSSGTAQNALATALTIDSNRTVRFEKQAVIATGRSAPNISFDASTGVGIFANSASYLEVVTSGAGRVAISDGAGVSFLTLPSSGVLGFSSGTVDAGPDVRLARDAANTLALRNGTNAQESRIYGSYTDATNYQRMSIKTLRESSGALSGASYTTTIAIPAYANLIGVTTRVTTAVTGATSYSVGDGSDVDLWGATIGVTLGSQSRTADFTAVGAVGAAATSRTVTLTANGSNFTGGVVEICLHYLTTEAD